MSMDPVVFIVIISVLGSIVGSIIGVVKKPSFIYMCNMLYGYITPGVLGFIIGATAGLMIYITLDEIITNSCAGNDHSTIFSLLTGIIFVILLGLI